MDRDPIQSVQRAVADIVEMQAPEAEKIAALEAMQKSVLLGKDQVVNGKMA